MKRQWKKDERKEEDRQQSGAPARIDSRREVRVGVHGSTGDCAQYRESAVFAVRGQRAKRTEMSDGGRLQGREEVGEFVSLLPHDVVGHQASTEKQVDSHSVKTVQSLGEGCRRARFSVERRGPRDESYSPPLYSSNQVRVSTNVMLSLVLGCDSV